MPAESPVPQFLSRLARSSGNLFSLSQGKDSVLPASLSQWGFGHWVLLALLLVLTTPIFALYLIRKYWPMMFHRIVVNVLNGKEPEQSYDSSRYVGSSFADDAEQQEFKTKIAFEVKKKGYYRYETKYMRADELERFQIKNSAELALKAGVSLLTFSVSGKGSIQSSDEKSTTHTEYVQTEACCEYTLDLTSHKTRNDFLRVLHRQKILGYCENMITQQEQYDKMRNILGEKLCIRAFVGGYIIEDLSTAENTKNTEIHGSVEIAASMNGAEAKGGVSMDRKPRIRSCIERKYQVTHGLKEENGSWVVDRENPVVLEYEFKEIHEVLLLLNLIDLRNEKRFKDCYKDNKDACELVYIQRQPGKFLAVECKDEEYSFQIVEGKDKATPFEREPDRRMTIEDGIAAGIYLTPLFLERTGKYSMKSFSLNPDAKLIHFFFRAFPRP